MLADDLKQAYQIILQSVYSGNQTSPRHEQFVRQLQHADFVIGRSMKPGGTNNQGNHLEEILTQEQIAEVLTHLAASVNQTLPSCWKRDTEDDLDLE